MTLASTFQDGMPFTVEAPGPEAGGVKPVVEVTEEELKAEVGEGDLKPGLSFFFFFFFFFFFLRGVFFFF